MTIRQINHLMRAAAITMIAGGVVAIAAAVFVPLNGSKLGSAIDSSAQSRSVSSPPTDLPPLDQFAPVFSAQLRGQPGTTSTPVTSATGLTLVGTIGDQIALVRSGDDTEARAIGEHFDGGQVIAIRNGEADLRTSDGIVTLHKQAEEPAPEYIHTGRNP
jgi:hypothetical protein